ncbi:MAG: choice-of-anchor L domain-containing protein [Saprospiraceae bacterium]|nr:choice-of-anchor L domain-containing protein [Saprospiraceae bacterium]MDW8483861.1 choice-of-anchor L domain-containing protein [Saprospiraceae bacterium]
MGNRLTFLLFSLFWAVFQPLLAQNYVSVQLDRQRQRIPLEVVYGANTIEVCGLIPGTTYSAVAVPQALGDRTPLVLRMADPGLEKEAYRMSRPDRPQHRQFVAPSTCVTFYLQVGEEGQSGPFAMRLSLGCVDCPEARAFLENFIKHVGGPEANLSVTGGTTPTNMVNTLIGGNCFQVSNITAQGPTQSRGTFSNGATNIGIANGIVMATGNVNSLPGPNNASNTSANTAGFNVNSPDDPDLATLSNGNQWDVIKLEFDFTPTAETVTFDYVFGSEEYCEYANSQYNDVFGFFISGPGINGSQNIAVLPVNGNPPVSINNVNHTTNTAFYVNNNNFSPCQNVGACCIPECALDGWTTVLTATAQGLIPCSTYHIKLAICDIADGLLFSAVFLKANSFNAGGVVKAVPIYPNNNQYAIEGCSGSFIRFIRGSGGNSDPLVVNFTVSGTATPGVDYATLPNSVTIPAGSNFIEIPVDVFIDNITEGQETIVITLSNPCSCDQIEITFYINDKPPLEVDLNDVTLCGVSSTTLTPSFVQPGQPPYTYAWSTGATTPSITVNTPGTNTYTVTVTDLCGATSTAQAIVTLEPRPTANLSGSGFFCENNPQPVNLTLTFTGQGPWTVEINHNGNTQTHTFSQTPTTYTVNEPGTYSLVSVATQSGCTGTATGTVTLNEIDVTVTLTPTNPTCNGANNGSIQASASGGNGPFTYAWAHGFNGANPTGLGPGTYTVTVTNGQGCTETESVELTEPPALTASAQNTGNIDCLHPTGSAEVTVAGGTPGYTYNWSGGSGGPNPTFSAAGTYTVTVSDANNCTVTASVTITADLTPPTAVASVPGPITCSTPEITLNGNGSSTGPNFSYEWNGPGITCCETTLQPTVNAPGTYVLTVTNSDNGCTATAAVTVQQNITPPTVVIAPPQNISCPTPTVTLNANGSSQGPNFTFVWSTNGGNFTGGTNSYTPTVNQAGTYTLVITNTTNGCTNEASVTVSGNTDPPTAVIAPPGVVNCYTPEIELDASSSSQGNNFTYQWSAGNGGNFTGGTNGTNPTVNAGGTYTITVTNTDNNCTATASVSVTSNLTPPTAVVAPPAVLTCAQPQITLSGNGSSQGPQFTYEWTANPGNIVSGENTLNPVVDEAGTYTLVVTNNDNGCTASATVNVNSNQNYPNANAGPDRTLNCTNPTISLQGSGSSGPNFTIQWTPNPGNIVSGGNTYTPVVNQPGTYILTVTNTQNGCSSTSQVTVSENFTPPTAVIAPPGVINCYNPTIELDASGSSQGPEFTFSWSANPGGFSGGANSPNPTVNQAGNYTVTVTNTDNGCTATASTTVTSDLTLPTAVAAPPPLLTCQNPQITLNGNGSSQGPQFTYAWTTPNGNIVSGENTLTPVVDAPGQYTLVVTNQDNGCTRSVTVSVTSNQNFPAANAGPERTLNCTHPTISLQGSGSSGPNFSIQWTPNPGNIVSGGNTYTPVVNQAGTYILTVTNTQNGCSSTSEVTVNANFDTPVAVIAPPGVINCYTPIVEIDAGGSSQGPPYVFNWVANPGNIVGGANSPYPNVNQPGTYFLTITNAESGCTATASVTVTANTTQPTATVAPPPILTCQNPQIVLNGNGSSQGPEFTYQWTTPNGNIVSGENTLTPTVDAPGQYTLVVTNQDNGCTRSITVNVNSNQNFPNANAGPEFLLNCVNPTLQLQGSGSTGPNIVIQWTANPGNIVSGANTYAPTINQPGVYYLVVTNTANGCSASDFVHIEANFDQPVAVIAPPGIINCYTPEIDLDASASTQGPDITYTWTTVGGNFVGGQNSPTPIINQGGTYNLLVSNIASGCTATASVVVQQNKVLPNANAGPTATLSCTVSQLTLQGSGSSGPNFTYEWWTPNGNIVSGENTLNPVIDAPGQYFLVVTNVVNGCTRQSSVNILADQNAPVAFGGADRELTCTNPSVQLNGTGSSTGPNIIYQWVANPGNIVSGANTLTPVVNAFGNYTLIVTNTQNGCTDTDEVWVEDNIVYPIPNIFPPQTLNCVFQTVQLDASGSSGSNLAYQWSPANRILSGQGTPVAEVRQPGVYTVVVTNTANGCSASTTATVNLDITPPVAVAVPQATITCQNPQTTLNGNGSSEGYPFFYLWTTQNGNIVSGELTLTPVVNQVGTYVLTVQNIENGCTATATVQVVSQQTFPTANAGPAQTLTCAAPQLSLNGTGSSQGQQFSYLWTTQNGNIVSGATTLTPVVNAPGTYVLTVINTQTGCTSTASVAVSRNTTLPVASVAPPEVLSCTNTSITLNGTASSQGGNFAYQWSTANGNIVSGANTLTPVVNATGTYTLVVTNTQNGCTASASAAVTADNSLPVANAGPADTLTCATTQLTLDGTASSQGADFAYTWTGPGIVSGANTLTPVVNQPGTYTLQVLNTGNGCSATSNVVIPADVTPPTAAAGPDGVLNCIQTALTLDATASSSGPNLTYQWTSSPGGNIVSGANTLAPVVNQPGTYTLLITNTANGCTATDAVEVTQNTTLPTANAGSSKTLTCSAVTAVLDGSGSTGPQFTYLWTTPNGSIASGANTLTPTVDAPGTYQLLVTDTQNGCTATASVVVNKDDNVPVAAASVPGPLTCAVKQVQINATTSTTGPGMQYTWTTQNGNIVSGANTLTPIVNRPGQYTLRVLNTANNCEAQFTIIVSEDLTPPAANAGTPAVISCAQPVLTLNGTASSQGNNFTYQWSTQNGNILSGANTLTPQVDRSGTYVLVVTNTQNGCTSSASVQILLDQNSPQAEAGPQRQLTCTANTVTLNGAGSSVGPNFLYAWTTPNGNIVSGANTLSPVVDAPGVYLLTVTNPDNGCSSVDSVNVVVNRTPPTAVIAPPPVLNCQLTQTPLSTAGSSSGSNFAYSWTTIGGGFVSGANTPSPIVNRPGTYNLVITNLSNGCTATASTVVVQNTLTPVVDAGPNAELNCAITSLSLNGTATNLGGSAAQIQWTTQNGNIVSGANTLNPVVNAPGVYTLVVTNSANFCSATDQVLVTQNTARPVAVVAAPPVLTCANPTAQLNGNGSSSGPLFAYQWTASGGGNILSGANTLIPTVNQPGTYRLIVTNTNNKCADTVQVTVLRDITPPDASAGNAVTLTCTSPVLQLNGAGSSTGPNFTYEWTTLNGNIIAGANTLQPTVNAPGTYTLVVTNIQNGCTREASVQVLQDATAPIAAIAAPQELTCLVKEIILNGSASSAGPQFTYQWTTSGGNIVAGAASTQPTVNAPGAYTLRVTNTQNGCTAQRTVNVSQNIQPPSAVVNAADTITCARTSVSLSAFGSGGGQGVRYAWTTQNGNIVSGANTAAPVVNAGGLYLLVVTDNYNGCTSTAQVSVPVNTQKPAIAIAAPALLTCTVKQTTLDASASAQGSHYTYTWTGPGIVSGGQTLTPIVNQPGNYALVILNQQNGCTATASTQVLQNTQPPVAQAGGDFELTCSVEQGTLNANGSSTGPNISYQWTTAGGNILSGANAPNPLVNAPGTYTLLVTNTLNGCTATDVAVVTKNTNYPAGLKVFSQPPGCDGRKGLIRFEEVQGGVGPYLYSIDGGNTFLSANQFANLNPGQYRLVVQDANGCEYEQWLVFKTPVQPAVKLDPEIRLEFGQSHTLRALVNLPPYEIDTIIWSPMESITRTNRPDVVIARPFTTTEYTVRVVNREGCEATARTIVRVGDPNLWAPNAISPNQGAGRNDVFMIFAAPNTVQRIRSLQIYDRWGNLVFRRENIQPNTPKHGWDGRFRGQPMNPAVFVWWAEVELTSGQVILMKGDLTIVD